MKDRIHIKMAALFASVAGALAFFAAVEQTGNGDPGAIALIFIGAPIMAVIGGFIGYLFGISILARKDPDYKGKAKRIIIVTLVIIILVIASIAIASWYHELNVPK